MSSFIPENVVEYFKRDKLPKLNNLMLIQEGPFHDMAAWMEHYKSIGCPHVVTREDKKDASGNRRTVFKIWKRRVV